MEEGRSQETLGFTQQYLVGHREPGGGTAEAVTAGGRPGRRGAVVAQAPPIPLRDSHPDSLNSGCDNLLLRRAVRSSVTSVEKSSLSLANSAEDFEKFVLRNSRII